MAPRDLTTLPLGTPHECCDKASPILSPRNLVSQNRTYGMSSADEHEIRNRCENGGAFQKNPVKCVFLFAGMYVLESKSHYWLVAQLIVWWLETSWRRVEMSPGAWSSSYWTFSVTRTLVSHTHSNPESPKQNCPFLTALLPSWDSGRIIRYRPGGVGIWARSCYNVKSTQWEIRRPSSSPVSATEDECDRGQAAYPLYLWNKRTGLMGL